MKPDEYVGMMYLFEKTAYCKNRKYNGSKPFPISLGTWLIRTNDPMRFSTQKNNSLSDDLTENTEKELTELGIDILGNDAADKCNKLFVSVLR